jgi:predicted exporter
MRNLTTAKKLLAKRKVGRQSVTIQVECCTNTGKPKESASVDITAGRLCNIAWVDREAFVDRLNNLINEFEA